MKNKTICLNMMVKNERKVIERCLASIKSLIDYWVIVDTGSSDGTQRIIREYLKDIPGELHERPWIRFDHNRNESLLLAKNKGDYLLIIDADDWLQIPNTFRLPNLVKDYYAVEFIHSKCRSMEVFLINNRIDWKWVGVVHEAIDLRKASGVILKGIIRWKGFDGNRSEDMQKKNLSDAQILETALQDEPDNSRYVFHLATCYEAAGRYELALKYYEKRVKMDGDHREIFYSFYRFAVMQRMLNMKPDIFINSYLKAYLYRSHRVEPLYWLAIYFYQTNCPVLSYLITRYALKVPFRDDLYFTQYQIYETDLKDLCKLCASLSGIKST
jgi:glycosyltransferase involved in cell wall biosynthesis